MKAFLLRLIRPIEWSLLTKLLVAFGLLAMIPLVLLGLYSYDVARQTVLQAQRQALISHTSDLAAHLDALLIERQASIRQLAEDAAVRAFGTAWPQALPEVRATAQEDLDNLAQINPYYQAVYLMSRQGEVILSSTDNAGLGFSFRPYFQAALAGKAYVSDISISTDIEEPVIYFSAPVRDETGEVVAVAVLRVLAEEIWSKIEVEKDELGPGSAAILFDEYGIRLAHSSDRSLIFKSVVPLDPEVEAQLLAEHRLGNMQKIESTDLPGLAEGLRLADSQPYFTHRLIARDELFHAGAARLTVKPWTVIESVPESAFMTPVRDMMVKIRFGIAATALMITIVSVLATWWIIRPLQELTTAAHKIAEGELDHPIARLRVQRGDELGRLIQSFESMRLSLRESYARLEARNRRLQRLYQLAIGLTGGVTDVADRVVDIIAELMEVRVAVVEEIHQDQIKVISMYDQGQIVHDGVFPLQGTPCADVQEVKGVCYYTEAVEQFPDDPFLAERNLNTYIGVPILDSQGEALGVVNAMDDRPRAFDDEDIRLLQTLAKRVGLEIERARAQETLRQSADLLRTISSIQGQYIANTPPEELFDRVLSEILSLTLSEYGFMGEVLYENDGTPYLQMLAISNIAWNEETRRFYEQYAPGGMEFRNLKTLYGAVITSGKPVSTNDPPADPRWGELPEGHPPLRAFLGLPLCSGEEMVGVVGVANRPGGYDEELVEYLQPILSTCVNLIQAYRIDQQRRQRELELEAIAEVGSLVTTGGDIQSTLDTLAEKIVQTAGFEAVGIGLYDSHTKTVSFPAVYAAQPMKLLKSRRGSTARLEDVPVLQQLLRDKRHIYFADPQNDPRIREDVRKLVKEDGVRSILTWPLLFGGELIGVLDLVSTRARSFTSEELSLLSTLADQTATAVQNARLFDEAQQRLRELSVMSDLSARLRSLLSKEDMLSPIVECTVDGLDAECAAIFTLDSHTNRVLVQKAHGECDENITDIRFSLEEMPTACAMRSGQPCFGQDDCPFFPGSGQSSKQACIPFKVNDRILGALHVDTHRPEGFGEENLRLLSGIADVAANSLRRADFFEEARLYKDAFNSTADAITITDLDSHILDVNPAFERVTGYSREEVLGHSPGLIKSRHSTPEFYQQMWDQILNQGYWSGEIINQRKGGDEWYSYLTISTVKDERGQPVAYLGINRDITERKVRERQREALLAVASALRQAPTRAEMLPVILDQVLTLTESGGALLAMRDPATGEMVIELGRGKWHTIAGIRLKEGEGITGLVVASGEAYVSDDLLNDPHLSRPDLLAGLKAGVCIPLISQEQTIGVLWVGRETAFASEEVRLLTAIGDMVANAIQRASLHEQVARRLKQVQALRTIDQMISSTLDLRLTLDILLEQVTTILKVDAAAVSVLIPNTGTLEIYSQRGFHTAALQPTTLRLGGTLAGRAVLENRILSVPDLAEAAETFDSAFLLAQEGFVSYYAVPLVAKGRVEGVLEIFHRAPYKLDSEWLEFLESLATQAAIAMDNAELFQGLQRSHQELIQAYDATLEGWVRALDLRDKETEDHTQRVTEMTLRLARAMGMRDEELVHVRRGALLHDIGKMGIPDSILHKPGKLTEQEWAIMRKHPVYAYNFLAPIEYLRLALDIPYCHHEKWDGSGYPRGLKGEQIPLTARIFAVVDVWDALSSDRPYRQAWPEEKVLAYIREQSGKHFDPQVVEAFLEIVK